MQHRLQAAIAHCPFGRTQLEQVQTVQRPAVRQRDFSQLLGGLGQGDVEAALAAPQAFQQELQGQRGLAGARRPLKQVQPRLRQPAANDAVQSFNSGCDPHACLHRRRRLRGKAYRRPCRRIV